MRRDSSLEMILFGTDEPVSEPIELRAGPLRLQLQDGKLFNLRLGDVEVWHGLSFVYRDTEWGTPEPVIEVLESTMSDGGFHVHCRGHFPTLSQPLPFRVEIEGRKDGSIRFHAEAMPVADLQTNRLGLCLMHPMSVGGARVAVEHIDGRQSLSTFPRLVPAWPPFMLIRAIRHEYARDHWARCEFEGDMFELEDQRNNADASFKTYSRSNLMPRPYWLRAGVPICQSAELWVEGRASQDAHKPPSVIGVRMDNEQRGMPALGIEILPDGLRPGEAVRSALASLRPAHLHLSIEGDPGSIDWTGVRELLALSGARLRLDLLLSQPADARNAAAALRECLQSIEVEPEGIAVFPSEPACLNGLRDAFARSRVGGGTPHFFVQLHRAERLGAMDFVSFTTSPIVHGTREDDIMAGLQSLPSLVETLRPRYPMPLRIGPSTLGARGSPLGAQPSTDGKRRIALARNDPRCRGLFGAAWCLGYLAQFERAGVESLTLMSLTGHSALVSEEDVGTLRRHPAYHVLSRLCAARRLRGTSVDDPRRVAAFALDHGDHAELLVANLTGHPLDIEMDAPNAVRGITVMDAASWERFREAPDPWSDLREAPCAPRQRLGAYGVLSLLVDTQ